jgi:single-strand DNA-binding protein
MSDFNKVILMGRLTAKPELRFTSGGLAVATLRVASSRRFKTKAGEEKDDSVFIDVTVWDKRAETCATYLEKGQKVLVEGRLAMRQWTTQTNEKRTTYEISAESVTFLEKSRGASAASESRAQVSDNDVPAPAASADDEEEIPF